MCIAIQAIAAEVRMLRDAVANGEADEDEIQLLEDYLAAAQDLERAYDTAAETVLNLPPYDLLTGEAAG